MKAKVYLVGAGPGDPELITVKGRRCIENADVIIYDYLASAALLKHASEAAEKIYVGKKGGDHTLSQDEINALIVQKARAGLTVCRLKVEIPLSSAAAVKRLKCWCKKALRLKWCPA